MPDAGIQSDMPPSSRLPMNAGRALLFVSLGFLLLLPFAGTAALRTVFLLACLVLVPWVWFKDASAKPPLLWVFMVWAGAALMATIAAENPADSFKHLKSEVGYSLLTYATFFLATAQPGAFVLFRRIATLSLAILGAGAVLAALSSGGRWVDGYYNQLGEYNTFVITSLPLVLTALLPSPVCTGRREQWLIAAALLTALLACFLSKSRGVWVVITFIAVAMTIYAWCHAGQNRRKAALVIGLLAGAGLLAAFSTASLRGTGLVQSSAREVIYSAALEHISAKPVLGHGFGRTSSQAYYETITPEGELIEHPHNLFLSYADQAGIVGLLALLCVLGAFLLRFGKAARATCSPLFAVAGLTLIAAVVLRSMPDMFFYGQNLWLFWAHCGILMHCALHSSAITGGNARQQER